jgi:hypothetical protein
MCWPFTIYHCDVSPSGSDTRSRFFLERRNRGSQIVEFGSALFLLIAFVFLPLLDLAIVPIRWMMAHELINNYVRTLAMCETYTQSLRTLEADPSLRDRLLKIGGIQVRSTALYLTVTHITTNDDTTKFIEITKPGTIPADWLPEGKMAPCQYLLVLNVQATISPAVLMNWDNLSVPGLTKPIPISIVVLHDWGNLGKDPATEKYFVNE